MRTGGAPREGGARPGYRRRGSLYERPRLRLIESSSPPRMRPQGPPAPGAAQTRRDGARAPPRHRGVRRAESEAIARYSAPFSLPTKSRVPSSVGVGLCAPPSRPLPRGLEPTLTPVACRSDHSLGPSRRCSRRPRLWGPSQRRPFCVAAWRPASMPGGSSEAAARTVEAVTGPNARSFGVPCGWGAGTASRWSRCSSSEPVGPCRRPRAAILPSIKRKASPSPCATACDGKPPIRGRRRRHPDGGVAHIE